jgi:hypothetical protein
MVTRFDKTMKTLLIVGLGCLSLTLLNGPFAPVDAWAADGEGHPAPDEPESADEAEPAVTDGTGITQDPGPSSESDPEAEAPILDANTRRISFQALLKDNGGTPLVGPVNLAFYIYNAAVGGALIQGPINLAAVPLAGGVADVQVPVNSASFTGQGRWLAVRVNGGAELAPRIPLTAVPHAIRVDRVASEELDDDIELGSATVDGHLGVWSETYDVESIELNGDGHRISTYGSDGLEQIRLYGPSWGEINLFDNTGNNETVEISADCGNVSFPIICLGDIGGSITLRNNLGQTRVHVYGGGSSVTTYQSDGGVGAVLDGDGFGGNGLFSVYAADGTTETVELIGAETTTTGASLIMRNALGNSTIDIDSDFGSTGEGWIQLRNSAGVAKITLDADVSGDGRITTQELQLTGGSDVSENFDIAPTAGIEAEPGMVVAIDPERTGKLRVSGGAYDRTVAGVVSGAGGVEPGMLMGQEGSEADGEYPVALTGRVYVLCDASRSAIAPGDLLTTSDTPGHAMKVTDHGRGQGAILGKAMSSLKQGKGLVLILVTLQ